MTLGSYTLIKNENRWIAAHLLAWLPVLDEVVLFDGNSTDGTLEIIEAIRDNTEHGHKIRLFKKKDPADLKDCYVGMFNECLWSVQSDMAFFLHPDFYPSVLPKNFDHLYDAIAASVKVKSFAGEPDGQLYRIAGRSEVWKPIARLRNPDLGAHYHGAYGAHNEDVYFSAITGNTHTHHGANLDRYPYEVVPSGIEVWHFSDVRTHARRLDRMKKCLLNQGNPVSMADEHPRVTLKPGIFKGHEFDFKPAEYPAEFLAARAKYSHLERNLVKA